MRADIGYAIAVVFCWGLFGVFVETLWTMLRKFKRNIVRVYPLRWVWVRWRKGVIRPVYRLVRRAVSRDSAVAEKKRQAVKRKKSVSTAVHGRKQASPFSLSTETNGWTFCMFGGGMPLLILVAEKLQSLGVGVGGRMVVYALGFWGMELLCGSLIRLLKSRVPWDYSAARWSACNGLIRLDYAPAWALLGVWVEHCVSFWVYQVMVPALQTAYPHSPPPFPWW